VAGFASEAVYLSKTRLGDLTSVNTRNADARPMNVKHHASRGRLTMPKYALEDMDHKLHARVVVVKQNDLEFAGLLDAIVRHQLLLAARSFLCLITQPSSPPTDRLKSA
jgi:hypothetical protein